MKRFMKIAIRIYDTIENRYVESDGEFLMQVAGMDQRYGFNNIAVQSHGSMIICDNNGNYGYLDGKRFNTTMMLAV